MVESRLYHGWFYREYFIRVNLDKSPVANENLSKVALGE